VAEIVTVPLKVPAPAVVRTDVSTETFTGTVPEAGVVPVVGVIFNHEPPVLVAGVAVKLVPEVPPTLIGCKAGAVAPI
jgi:hypothetical protein